MNFTDAGVKGADVSFWQDDNQTPQRIDFSKMVDQGASFVIIRAGQNKWVDPDFSYNWKAAKDAGLPRGAYWFYDSRVSPEEQADLCASLFLTDKPELEMWLDLEDNYGGNYSGYVYWKRFLERFKSKLPDVTIGIYTSYGYFSGKIPLAEYPYFAKYQLWLANYNSVEYVKIPAPWTSCLYWQWGTPPWGIEWGCESKEIDMNLFNGTLDDFKRRYNIAGGKMNYGVTLVRLNVRSVPNGTILYTMDVGTPIEADRIENGWWHLTKVNGVAITREEWAYEGATSGYIKVVEPPVPPPSTGDITVKATLKQDGTVVGTWTQE